MFLLNAALFQGAFTLDDLINFVFTVRGMIVVVLIGVITYYYGVFLSNKWKLRHFRGPIALPFIGNLYDARVYSSFFRWIGIQRKQYGKVFSVFLGVRPLLIVTEPVVVRRILSDAKSFPKGDMYSNKFSVVFGLGLVTSGNEKHRHDRGIFNKLFIRSSVSKWIPLMNTNAKETIAELITPQFKDNNKIISFDCEPFFARLALRTFMQFAFGMNYKNDELREKLICHMTSTGSMYVGLLILYDIPEWEIFPMIKFLHDLRAEIWKDASKVCDERRVIMAANNGEDGIDDCITYMLKENMTKKDIIDHCVTLLCAGHDTTSFFAAYLCMVLAENPECQTTLRECIRKQLNGRTEVTADDIAEMKYLLYVMQETLRLFAVIPQLSRVCTQDVVIKEYNDLLIPAGTDILIPLYLMNRDPAIWDDPTKFDPMRWEGRGEYTSAKDGFFPFGYGSRTCIGNVLAQLEVSVFLSQLLLQYEVLPEPGFKVNILAGISLTTSNGVKIKVKKLDS